MRPQPSHWAHADGELAAGTHRAGRPQGGPLSARNLRSIPSTRAGGSEFVSPSRGPPHGLASETRKTGARTRSSKT